MPLAPVSPFTTDRQLQAPPQRNRLYDTAAWKRYRVWRLSIQPFCQACERKGLIAIRAVDVHHLVALRDGGAPYDSTTDVVDLSKSRRFIRAHFLLPHAHAWTR